MNDNIAIRVENLTKKYVLQHSVKTAEGNDVRELHALSNISFTVKKGEAVGIVGANGSGKSTLLRILAGVTQPTSGKVEVYGRVASILDIGAGFHPELSGRDNVFLNGQLLGFSKKEIRQRFDEIVAFSGIEKFIDEPVKNYSNGMYLRLAFSIMAHLDFDVYLLDEVISAGDEAFKTKIANKIQDVSYGKSLVIISHQISEIQELINKVFLIQNHELLKFDNVKEGLEYYIQSHQHNHAMSSAQAVAVNKRYNDFISFSITQPGSEFLHDDEIVCSRSEKMVFTFIAKNIPETEPFSVGIYITNAYDVRVFAMGPVEQNGTFSWELPANLLVKGTYFVNLMFIDVNDAKFRVKKYRQFSVVTDSEMNTDSYNTSIYLQ